MQLSVTHVSSEISPRPRRGWEAAGKMTCWKQEQGFQKGTFLPGMCWRIQVQGWLRNARGLMHIQCCSLPEGLCHDLRRNLPNGSKYCFCGCPSHTATCSFNSDLRKGKYHVGVCSPSLMGPLPGSGVFAHTTLYPKQQLFLVNA